MSTFLRPLLAELERRVRSTPEDLSSLLNECHNAWMSTRLALMSGRVNEEVGRMDPANSDLVDLASSF